MWAYGCVLCIVCYGSSRVLGGLAVAVGLGEMEMFGGQLVDSWVSLLLLLYIVLVLILCVVTAAPPHT